MSRVIAFSHFLTRGLSGLYLQKQTKKCYERNVCADNLTKIRIRKTMWLVCKIFMTKYLQKKKDKKDLKILKGIYLSAQLKNPPCLQLHPFPQRSLTTTVSFTGELLYSHAKNSWDLQYSGGAGAPSDQINSGSYLFTNSYSSAVPY